MFKPMRIFKISTVLALAFISDTANAQEARPFANIPTIHATAIARQSVAPDEFMLDLLTMSDGPTSEAALATITPKIDKLLDAVKKAGIDDLETKSPGPSTEAIFRHYYDANGREISEKREATGYRAYYRLIIKSKKLDRPGVIIPLAVAAGATVNNLSFDISNRQELLRSLELTAVKEAVARAHAMIAATGAKPGRVLEIDAPDLYDPGTAADLHRPVINPMRDISYAIRPGMIDLEERHQVTIEILNN